MNEQEWREKLNELQNLDELRAAVEEYYNEQLDDEHGVELGGLLIGKIQKMDKSMFKTAKNFKQMEKKDKGLMRIRYRLLVSLWDAEETAFPFILAMMQAVYATEIDHWFFATFGIMKYGLNFGITEEDINELF